MSSTIDPTTKLLFTFTGVMAVLMGVIVYAVLGSDDGEPWRKRERVGAPSEAGKVRCDATKLDSAQCPANHYCHIDRCEPVAPESVCQAGESCRERSCCAEGLVCHHYRCVDATKVDRTPMLCRKNKRLSEAVKTLADKCSKRSKDVGDIVTAGSCSTADWEALAIEDDKFDLLLSAFPNRFAVHFPPGRPFIDVKRKGWPTSENRAFYTAQIRAHAKALREAKQIFIIGRASPEGKPEDNRQYALRRMTMVSEIVDVVRYEGMSQTQRAAHPVRIRSFALPTELPDGSKGARPIDPARYREVYLSDPPGSPVSGLDPIVTWDPTSKQEIERLLGDPAVLAAGEGAQWNFLFSAVNRVVLVIPIPCLGDEYEPDIVDGEP